MVGLRPGGPDGVGVTVKVGELVGVGELARAGVLVEVAVLVWVGELTKVGVLVEVAALVGVGELAEMGVLVAVAVAVLVGVDELAKVGVLVKVGEPCGASSLLPDMSGSHTNMVPACGTTVAWKCTWPGVPALKGCAVEAKETWLRAIVERNRMPEISSRPKKTERRAFIRGQPPPLVITGK